MRIPPQVLQWRFPKFECSHLTLSLAKLLLAGEGERTPKKVFEPGRPCLQTFRPLLSVSREHLPPVIGR